MSTTWEPVEDWEPVLRAGWFWQWYYCNSVLVDVDEHPSHPALVRSDARALASHLTGVPDGFALPLLFPLASTRADEDGNARRWLREAWTRTGVLDADRVAALVDALTVFPDDRGRPVPEDADPADSIASPPSISRAPAVADAVAHLLAAVD